MNIERFRPQRTTRYRRQDHGLPRQSQVLELGAASKTGYLKVRAARRLNPVRGRVLLIRKILIYRYQGIELHSSSRAQLPAQLRLVHIKQLESPQEIPRVKRNLPNRQTSYAQGRAYPKKHSAPLMISGPCLMRAGSIRTSDFQVQRVEAARIGFMRLTLSISWPLSVRGEK
jgi:hypothetical protein